MLFLKLHPELISISTTRESSRYQPVEHLSVAVFDTAIAACVFQTGLGSVHTESVHESKVSEQVEPLGTGTILVPRNGSVSVVDLVICVA